jgi:hypothetical protein
MEVVTIILSLVLLIYFAYRGYSVIFFAPSSPRSSRYWRPLRPACR